MVDELRPYPKYKESLLTWLGKVPEHWKEKRAKYYFYEVDERSTTGTEQLMSVSHKTGVTPRKANVTMFMAESNIGHKICRPGDLVINTMWAWMAAMGVVRKAGIVSPSYGVYRPLPVLSYIPGYIDYLIRAQPYVSEYICRSTGIRSSRLRLYPDDFLCIPFVCPPIQEQKSIVKFITYIDELVRRFIRNRRRMIEIFAERLEATTNDALKIFGTQQLRLGVVADRVERPINNLDNEIYTPIGLFNWGRGIFHKPPTKSTELGDSSFFLIKEGDLVLSGQFAWEGAVALAGQEDTGCVASHRYPILRGKNGIVESAYLFSFFRTGMGHVLLDHHSRGAAGRNRPLNASNLMKEKIPIPPSHVQQGITDFVKSEATLRRYIASEIALVKEYRTRLITDVVTGKLDVRHISPEIEVEQAELINMDEDIHDEEFGYEEPDFDEEVTDDDD